MDTTKLVKAYEADLKDENKKSFNIWAFIFAEFYFMYMGIGLYFVIFIFLPFIAMIPFALICDTPVALAIGYLISHIIAGFVAVPATRKYKENFIKMYASINTQAEVEYFAISLPRLLISMFLTDGIYALYWGFKNWKRYRDTTKDDVNPYIRAWFFNWVAYSLFSKIRQTTKMKKEYTYLGLLCLVITLVSRVISYCMTKNMIDESLIGMYTWILLATVLVYPLCFIPVQKSINKYTTETLKKPLDKHFYFWETIILILGLILNGMFWFGNPFVDNNADFTSEQAQRTAYSIGFIYRHTQGYANVCQQEGYILSEYPVEFNNLLAADIKALNNALAQKGYNIEKATQELITPQQAKLIYQSVRDELEKLRKIWTIRIVADEYNIPPENIEWSEELDSVLTIKDTCELFDKNGIELLKAGGNINYLKNNML